MGFILGLAVGTVVTAVVFIVFGHKNRNKINAAREAIVNAYEHLGDKAEDIIGDFKNKDKKTANKIAAKQK